MQGTIKKWIDHEVPEWFDEEQQEIHPDPEKIVHFRSFVGTPVWEEGFAYKKPKWGALNMLWEAAETMPLVEFIQAAEIFGWVVDDGWGCPNN